MEVQGNRHAESNTRIYSPTHGSSAYAYAPAAPKRQQPAARPEERVERVPRQRPREKQRLAAGTRFSLFIAIMAMSAALLTVVFRYNDIAAQYALVNDLQESITKTEQDIKSLNVMLECAVSIQEVQEAAKSWGMDYPEASQYILAGDPLPMGAAETPGEDAQADALPEADVQADVLPEADTPQTDGTGE